MEPSPKKDRVEITLNLAEDIAGLLYKKVKRAVNQKPKELKINLIGQGHVKQDSVLMLWELLTNRDPATKLITHARTSLYDGSLLLFLISDERIARPFAFFQIDSVKRIKEEVCNEDCDSDDYFGLFGTVKNKILSPYKRDYLQIASIMNQYIPVEDLSDRQMDLTELKDYGLLFTEEEEHNFQQLFKAA